MLQYDDCNINCGRRHNENRIIIFKSRYCSISSCKQLLATAESSPAAAAASPSGGRTAQQGDGYDDDDKRPPPPPSTTTSPTNNNTLVVIMWDTQKRRHVTVVWIHTILESKYKKGWRRRNDPTQYQKRLLISKLRYIKKTYDGIVYILESKKW